MSTLHLKSAVEQGEVARALDQLGRTLPAASAARIRAFVDQRGIDGGDGERAVRDCVSEALVCFAMVPGALEGHVSAAKLSAGYARGTMPRDVVEVLYAIRNARVETLASQPEITQEDLVGLDRGGKFRVADELFGRCTRAAQSALLDDNHPHVRSAATLAQIDAVVVANSAVSKRATETPTLDL